MVIERLCTFEIVGFSRCRFLSQCLESFIDRHQFFRAQVTRSVCTACGISSLLLTNHAISHFDSFAAVFRLGVEYANIVAVIAVLYFFPFHWDVQLFLGHSLKGIGLRQRYPDTGFSFDLWKFNSIDELELVRAFDDAGIVGSASPKRDRQKKYRKKQ